jgi:hypothetical protein
MTRPLHIVPDARSEPDPCAAALAAFLRKQAADRFLALTGSMSRLPNAEIVFLDAAFLVESMPSSHPVLVALAEAGLFATEPGGRVRFLETEQVLTTLADPLTARSRSGAEVLDALVVAALAAPRVPWPSAETGPSDVTGSRWKARASAVTLSILLTQVVEARATIARQRGTLNSSADPNVLSRAELLDALEMYAAALAGEGLPVPYHLRDEIRLQGRLVHAGEFGTSADRRRGSRAR